MVCRNSSFYSGNWAVRPEYIKTKKVKEIKEHKNRGEVNYDSQGAFWVETSNHRA